VIPVPIQGEFSIQTKLVDLSSPILDPKARALKSLGPKRDISLNPADRVYTHYLT
jgi:hypothetical protein